MNVFFKIFDFVYTKLVPESHHDKMVLEQLDRCMKSYPNLRKVIPQSWPRHSKHGITNRRMHKFNKARRNKPEGMNLPLFLHLSEVEPDKKMREIFQSILVALDWFASEMMDKPGAKSVLEPLWTSTWDQLRIWAVVSEVFLIRHLKNNTKFQLQGFDRKIPGSKKTADIHATLMGRNTWIDVEASALDPFKGTALDFRKLLEMRIRKKMAAKFSDLSLDQSGMIISIYRIMSPENLRLFQTDSILTKPIAEKNVSGSIFWLLQGRKLGTQDPFAFHLESFTAFDKTEF